MTGESATDGALGPRHFCTLFDANYLTAGLSLYESLDRHLPAFDLWVLCLDDTTHEVLGELDLAGLTRVHLRELEGADEQLLATKADRSLAEYYFTCQASLPQYVLANWPSVPRVTYLDADLYFFGWDEAFEAAFEGSSIVVHPHRFPPGEDHRNEEVGRFNAGFSSFRNDEEGRACARLWRERCIEWCYDRHEEGRFANQQYLEEWPDRFERVRVLDHEGAGVARWNVGNYEVRHEDGRVTVDGTPLVFYHFERLRAITDWLWHPHLSMTSVLREHVYEPYVRARRRHARRVRAATGREVTHGTGRHGFLVTDDTLPMNVLRTGYRVAKLCEAALRGDLIVCRE